MIGCQLIATYIPNNTIVTPDPAAGAWGDALGHYDSPVDFSGWIGAAFTYNASALLNNGPAGPPTFAACNYVNTTDSAKPAIRLTLLFDVNVQETDLTVLQSIFEAACSDASTISELAAFDSLGSMSFEKSTIELWSNEESI